MSKAFILGLQKAIEQRGFLSTDELYSLVGHNTGNLAFHYAIDSHLGGDIETASWGADPEAISQRGNIGVLPCANQLGAHADYGSFAERFSRMSPSMVAIGLGAQSGLDGTIPDVPKGTLQWIEEICRHAPSSAPNISVRGDFSLNVLEHYGFGGCAEILGCPTLFINPDPFLGRAIAERVRPPLRIAVTAGHQRWRHLAQLEHSLVQMALATSGSYVTQSPLEMVQLGRGEARLLDVESIAQCRAYVAPSMSNSEFIAWSEKHALTLFDIPSWIEHYRRFDFVVGTRIHGIMLALQAGIPSLCIAHDSRTLELCETMKIPYVLAREVTHGISRDALMDLFTFDANDFDKNRRLLAHRYLAFLKTNGLVPAKWLMQIASTAED